MSRVVHFEFSADDTRRAQEFFAEIFGWRFEKYEGGEVEYWTVLTGEGEDDGINGGMGPRPPMNPAIVNTIGVDDLDATLERIEASGGSVAMRKMPIPGMGWVAYFRDTEDNLWGVYQSDDEAA